MISEELGQKVLDEYMEGIRVSFIERNCSEEEKLVFVETGLVPDKIASEWKKAEGFVNIPEHIRCLLRYPWSEPKSFWS